MRVGLLGGSFNPAHAGHVHISIAALKDLRLDQVWWLVSPQNPLKPTEGMLGFEHRIALADNVIKHPRIKVVDIEKRLPNAYSINTIQFLKRAYPKIEFAWIIGADNLVQFHQWRRWKELFSLLPIIVYDRGNYRTQALAGRAACYFRKGRITPKKLFYKAPPAWSIVIGKKNPLSSTEIRLTHSLTHMDL